MLKVVGVNVLVFLLLILVVELVMGLWFSNHYVSNCYTEKYHHEYCKGWVGFNSLAGEDGGGRIPIFVNQEGVRVESLAPTLSGVDVSRYNVINIGDSFMQADEVEFNETLSSNLNEVSGKRALQVGYSSWAPIQMYNWIKSHDIQKGSIVNLFTMVNDYIPSYRGSNINYHKEANEGKDGLFYFSKYQGNTSEPKEVILTWREQSFFIGKYDQWKKNKKRSLSTQKKFSTYKTLTGTQFDKLSKNCGHLESWVDVPPLTYDYLSFSFVSKCWSPEQIEAVENTLVDINKIYKSLMARGVELNVFVIPPGWSFQSENLEGKASAAYKIAPDTTLTIAGLTEYVTENTSANVFDLELVISGFKKETEKKMYFNYDGHWTKDMHEKLAAWMATNVLFSP